MSSGLLGRIVEYRELGSHEEPLPVESHPVVLTDPVPLLAVKAVPELRDVPCLARTEVSIDTEPDLVLLERDKIWLRIDADFRPGETRDMAKLWYSLDGKEWNRIGNDYRMRFDWQRFFMGSKFAIFNYATKEAGGYVDVDYFAYEKINN